MASTRRDLEPEEIIAEKRREVLADMAGETRRGLSEEERRQREAEAREREEQKEAKTKIEGFREHARSAARALSAEGIRPRVEGSKTEETDSFLGTKTVEVMRENIWPIISVHLEGSTKVKLNAPLSPDRDIEIPDYFQGIAMNQDGELRAFSADGPRYITPATPIEATIRPLEDEEISHLNTLEVNEFYDKLNRLVERETEYNTKGELPSVAEDVHESFREGINLAGIERIVVQ